jgi:WD40 repeat protein
MDETVRLWDVATGECQHVLENHGGIVTYLTYSPPGCQIVLGDVEGNIREWSTTTGECLRSLSGKSKNINCLVYSPQGDLLISSSDDEMVRLWDLRTGDCRHVFNDHTVGTFSISFSPGGGLFAYGCKNGQVRVRDTQSEVYLKTLVGHTEAVRTVVFSRQGDLLISAGEDKTVRLWNVASGECRAVIEEFQDSVNDIEWIETSDCAYLVAACEDGVLGMWQVKSEGDQLHVRLRWRTTKGDLTAAGASIQDARGLSTLNKKLLKQRGATGEPVDTVRQARER